MDWFPAAFLYLLLATGPYVLGERNYAAQYSFRLAFRHRARPLKAWKLIDSVRHAQCAIYISP
jgi:hypothetical protein